MHIPYIECSAKFRKNVDQAFHDLARLIRYIFIFILNNYFRQFKIQDRANPTEEQENLNNKKRKKNCRIQ